MHQRAYNVPEGCWMQLFYKLCKFNTNLNTRGHQGLAATQMQAVTYSIINFVEVNRTEEVLIIYAHWHDCPFQAQSVVYTQVKEQTINQCLLLWFSDLTVS